MSSIVSLTEPPMVYVPNAVGYGRLLTSPDSLVHGRGTELKVNLLFFSIHRCHTTHPGAARLIQPASQHDDLEHG